MTSLVEYDGFYDAARARQIAMGQSSGNSDVLTEINDLQGLVDSAAASGTLETIVAGITTMTSSASFFDSWNDPYNNDTPVDQLNRVKMNYVVNYFSRMGYTIRRNRIGLSNTFEWRIKW